MNFTRLGIRLLLTTSIVLLALWYWNKDVFPEQPRAISGMEKTPDQVRVDREPLMLESSGVEYRVKPLYRYELTGMVVSYARHSGDRGLHELWNDHLNVADVCVVWGRNAREVALNAFDFWNGQFTCRYSTGSEKAWQQFNPDQLSNNHLITNDPRVRGKIEDLRVGDQIRIDGWLAHYGEPGQSMRKTSTTRTDSGNGACETILVEDFRVVRSMDNPWRALFWPGLLGLLGSVVWWLAAPTHRFAGR